MQADTQLSLVKNLMHVVSVGTRHVSLNIQLYLWACKMYIIFVFTHLVLTIGKEQKNINDTYINIQNVQILKFTIFKFTIYKSIKTN